MSKMTVEKAREMRDAQRRQRRVAFAPQPGTRKHRELRFDRQHGSDEVAQAHSLLAGIEGLEVEIGLHINSLSIWYDVRDCTLEGLEAALRHQGFHLDNSLSTRLLRAMVHFCEETQLRNLRVPERLIKKSNQVYSKAWDQHLHGDHDDTPPDLRLDR